MVRNNQNINGGIDHLMYQSTLGDGYMRYVWGIVSRIYFPVDQVIIASGCLD